MHSHRIIPGTVSPVLFLSVSADTLSYWFRSAVSISIPQNDLQWDRKQDIFGNPFYPCSWHNYSMEFIKTNIRLILSLAVLAAFVISTAIDRRRYRNGIYFLSSLVLFAVYLLDRYQRTRTGYVITAFVIGILVFLMLAVPVLLIYNGFVMVKNEGFRIPNLLSFLFGIMVFIGDIGFLIGMAHIPTGLSRPRLLVYAGFSFIIFYISFLFLSYLIYTLIILILPRRSDFNYVIVLGSGLIDGDKVSRLLADRLDKGILVYENSSTSCKIIVSGGQGPDEKIPEALAMKNYLLEKGIREPDIIMEDKSKDTMENLANCQKIIKKQKGSQHTAVVTSGYHTLRAMIYARHLKFPITGIGARTAYYYWPSALIREFAALCVRNIVPFFTGMVVSGTLLYLLTF